jgi:hypothetical protein
VQAREIYERAMPLPILDKLVELTSEIWQVENLTGKDIPQTYPLFKIVGALAKGDDKARGDEWLGRTFAALQDEVGGDLTALSRHAAMLYLRPVTWIGDYSYNHELPVRERALRVARGEIIQTVLHEWLKLHPTNAMRALLSERLGVLLRSENVRQKPDLFRPTLVDCLDLLFADPSEDATGLLNELMQGYLGVARAGSVEEPELRKAAPAILYRLSQNRIFDYHSFRRAMYNFPGVFHDLSLPLEQRTAQWRNLPPVFAVQIQSFTQRFIAELAENLPLGNAKSALLLKQVGHLEGATWLLLACAYVEEKQIKKLPGVRSKKVESAATRLCQTERPLVGVEDDAATVEFLRQYSPDTLHAVLPHAVHYRDLVEQATSHELRATS